MPTTRRKRANPPEQPENSNQLETQQAEVTAEAVPAPVEQQASHEPQAAQTEVKPDVSPSSSEVNTENSSQPSAATAPSLPTFSTPAAAQAQAQVPSQPSQVHTAAMNGTGERGERVERNEQEAYTPPPVSPSPTTPHPIEGGRRTPRGELFRRPPQPPIAAPVQPAPVSASVSMQAPTHEITLPLGKRPGDTHGDPLHLAYNPGYTGSDEARSLLLHKLAQESKSGGRARCWNCGSIAIIYDRWNTRSKTFGEIGIAMCEICGVWSVM